MEDDSYRSNVSISSAKIHNYSEYLLIIHFLTLTPRAGSLRSPVRLRFGVLKAGGGLATLARAAALGLGCGGAQLRALRSLKGGKGE